MPDLGEELAIVPARHFEKRLSRVGSSLEGEMEQITNAAGRVGAHDLLGEQCREAA